MFNNLEVKFACTVSDMKSLSKLILCLLWWGFITASGTFRQSIKNACLSVHHSQDAAFHQVYWDKFLTEDDTAWLSAEIHATYSEVEARSKKGRIHPLSKEPFLVHYVESFIHTEVLPAMNRRYGFTERLLGIKDIYFEIQSFGVKRARESLVAASKKNSGDLTFVLLLNNTNAGSGNVQIFNMSTVREDSYLYDVDDSQHLLFDNEGQIISDEHAPEEIPLFDHETITSLDQKCLENCEECEACNGLMKPEYGPLYPVDESSVVNVQLSAGEGVFFPAQRYYRISPVHWTNGTDPM